MLNEFFTEGIIYFVIVMCQLGRMRPVCRQLDMAGCVLANDTLRLYSYNGAKYPSIVLAQSHKGYIAYQASCCCVVDR